MSKISIETPFNINFLIEYPDMVKWEGVKPENLLKVDFKVYQDFLHLMTPRQVIFLIKDALKNDREQVDQLIEIAANTISSDYSHDHDYINIFMEEGDLHKKYIDRLVANLSGNPSFIKKVNQAIKNNINKQLQRQLEEGELEIAQQLINAEANINFKKEGKPLIQRLLERLYLLSDSIAVFKFLVDQGVEIDFIVNKEFKHFLSVVVEKAHNPGVMLLFKYMLQSKRFNESWFIVDKRKDREENIFDYYHCGWAPCEVWIDFAKKGYIPPLVSMMKICSRCKSDNIRELFESCGYDINTREEYRGWTFLNSAIDSDNKKLSEDEKLKKVKFIVEQGAYLNVESLDLNLAVGESKLLGSPLKRANEIGYKKISKYLEKLGAISTP